MYDDLDTVRRSGWTRLPPQLRAALVCAIPFVVADFLNYYSAGAALILSLPILAIIYLGCGVLAAKFATADGRADQVFVGAVAAFLLWGISLLINGVIALVSGAVTFGASLLLGLPYICICGPLQLIGGGLAGALGAWLYKRVAGRRREDDWS